MNHRWTDTDRALLVEMSLAGASVKEIAAVIGAPRGTVQQFRGRLIRDMARTCPTCGGPVPYTGKPGRRPTFCTPACAELRWDAQRMNATIDGRPRTCAHCRGPLSMRHRGLFCSRACSERAWWERAMHNPGVRQSRQASRARALIRWRQCPIRLGVYVNKQVVIDTKEGEQLVGRLELGWMTALLHGADGELSGVAYSSIAAVTLA